ncbi:RteC domain-containing protein [Algoriphagus resistens]|uniref:RteC domain-containing protein n=1 Tax=Algoriphagus resistens TaxID=1750590 RepID=UPI0012F76162|nr:RteC domain-containing protein [Algoriphagus resistens]
MSILNYSNQLYEKLQLDLAVVKLEGDNRLIKLESAFSLVDKAMDALKRYLVSYKFEDEEQEIIFFKFYMSKFLKDSIFYSELFGIESNRPVGSRKYMKQFYEKELRGVRDFLTDQQGLYNYMLLKKSHFDRTYFLRNSQSPILKPNLFWHTLDTRFCTVYTVSFARIEATLAISDYLYEELTNLNGDLKIKDIPKKFNLTWTAPKVYLVELIYSLKASGVFNHGTADIREIAAIMEILFDKDMKDYYRTFQEIRIRKRSRTVFLDLCKDKLESYMEESEGV